LLRANSLPAVRPWYGRPEISQMRHSLITLTTLLAVCSTGCTSDLQAPSNYLFSDDSADTDGSNLEVVCGDIPRGAVGADFAHTITAGDGNLTYAFADAPAAPAGLSIDSSTGEITGVPEEAGMEVTFGIVVTDDMEGSGEATCTVEISPQLSVDLSDLAVGTGCLTDEDLQSLVVPGTGDGSPITCDAPGGSGNGRMPEGHAVGLDSCEIEGSLTADRFGTWVVMMRGTQSGAEVWVPFCITEDDESGSYDVTVAHSGEDDNTFAPLIGTFGTAPFSVASVGDPHFTVEDPASCGTNSCSYGFNYSISGSKFNLLDTDNLVTGDGLLEDDMMVNIGMEHDIVALEGDEIDEDFLNRPWTLSVGLDYCISEVNADCTGDAIQDNAGARFEFSVLMFPDSL